MGMYDSIKYECVCPVCHSKVNGFQSKDGPCLLNMLQPTEVDNFYSPCSKCGCWLEFTAEDPGRGFCERKYTRKVFGKHDNELSEHRKTVAIKAKVSTMQNIQRLILNLPGEMLHHEIPLEELLKFKAAVEADINEIRARNLEDEL